MSIPRRNVLVFASTAMGVGLSISAAKAFAASGGAKRQAAKRRFTSVLHFSPTGSTAEIANHLGAALAEHVTEIDLTRQTLESCSFANGDFTVIAVPVFAGRVPSRAAEALRLCSGNGSACVSIVVCGGRAIDDALLELNDILTEQGFMVIASGAFAARHSIVEEIAAGRPDAQDMAELDAFAVAILAELASGKTFEQPRVPGNRPYIVLPAPTITPEVNDSCIECGLCAERCPVSAIPQNNVASTIQEKCILCMRCVWSCPASARALPPAYRAKALEMLRQKCPARLAAQTYL